MGTRVYAVAGGVPSFTGEKNWSSGVAAGGGGETLTVQDTDLTVHCVIDEGDDETGDGSEEKPYDTLERALKHRASLIMRDAVFTIQLHGDNDWPNAAGAVVGGWAAQGSGRTVIRGQQGAEFVHATATADGDFGSSESGLATFPIVTGVLGAVDTHRGRWIRFTTGDLTGSVFQIARHSDASVTVCTMAGAIIAAGDMFDVISPGTRIFGTARLANMRSSDSSSGAAALTLFDVVLDGSATFDGVDLSCLISQFDSFVSFANSSLTSTLFDATSLGLPPPALAGCGVWFRDPGFAFSTFGITTGGQLAMVVDGVTTIQQQALFALQGARFVGGLNVLDSAAVVLGDVGDFGFFQLDATLDVRGRVGCPSLGGVPVSRFAVSAGSCIRVRAGGLVDLQHAWSGGTSDPAGYGIDVRGGGRCFSSVQPEHTGGTAGSDLRTTNTPIAANSALASPGSAVGTAADAALGEVLARA